MNRRLGTALIFGGLFGCAAIASLSFIHKPTPKPLPIKVFESVLTIGNTEFAVAKPENPQKGLIIYIEDEPQRVNDKALFTRLAELSYVAVKINWSQIADKSCDQQTQLVSDLTQLAFSQEKFSQEQLPIIVGDHAAAELIYPLMKKNRYHSGISLHLPMVASDKKTACTQAYNDPNAEKVDLHANWYIFNSPESAGEKSIQDGVNRVSNAKFTLTDNTPDSAVKESVQILQWLDPRLKDQLSSAQAKGNLPIVEVPATATPSEKENDLMVVFLTGDGGWAAIDKNVAKAFADRGIPTLGVDSLSYFWKARTPQETAQDIEKATTQYLKQWNKKRILLVGYSFGADVMPFLINRFPENFKKKISMVTLLSMGKTAAFEFKLSSWMNADKRPERPPTLPELQKISGLDIVCVYGLKDPDSVCSQTDALGATSIGLPGNHHFNDDYPLLMSKLFEHLEK